MKEGIAVTCKHCGRQKKPRGRSAPYEMGGSLCDDDCDGYNLHPHPGDLWPGETEEEFGFPVGANATEDRVRVSVNGAERVAVSPLSYFRAVEIGLWPAGATVTYQGPKHGDAQRSGILAPDESVDLEEGMRLEAYFTGNA